MDENKRQKHSTKLQNLIRREARGKELIEDFLMSFAPRWFTFVGWLFMLGGLVYFLKISIQKSNLPSSILIGLILGLSALFLFRFLTLRFGRFIQIFQFTKNKYLRSFVIETISLVVIFLIGFFLLFTILVLSGE